MPEECRNCRFSKNYAAHLRCRRYPPDTFGSFPLVEHDDWCGEWFRMRTAGVESSGTRPGPEPNKNHMSANEKATAS